MSLHVALPALQVCSNVRKNLQAIIRQRDGCKHWQRWPRGRTFAMDLTCNAECFSYKALDEVGFTSTSNILPL